MDALKRPQNAQEKIETRRQQVLDAATECFLREGFHGTSIARISRQAGMSAGHIYHYFENKEAIVEGIAERERHEMVGMLDSLDRCDGSLSERICSHTSEMMQRATRPDIAGLMLELAAEGMRNPAVRDILQRSDHEIADAFFSKLYALGVPVGLEEGELRMRMQLVICMLKGLTVRQVHCGCLDLTALRPLIDEVIHYLLPDPVPEPA